jgi:hypothetical protein
MGADHDVCHVPPVFGPNNGQSAPITIRAPPLECQAIGGEFPHAARRHVSKSALSRTAGVEFRCVQTDNPDVLGTNGHGIAVEDSDERTDRFDA